MFIRVEKSSAIPISRQIADQVRAQCLVGTLAVGSRLPSVRQLARELTVNQNTILKVYERLADEGLLERRQGEGTFVSGAAPRGRLESERQEVADALAQIVRHGRLLGLGGAELHALLDDAMLEAPAPPGVDHTEGPSS